MAKDYAATYYTLEEDEIQDIIARAKNKEGQAQMELLKIFSNFLQKYVALLYHGRYSLKDYDVRRFVALFVPDSIVRFYLVRNKLDAKGTRYVNECLRGIIYMVRRYGTEEDVKQTINLAFFQCLDRYQRQGPIPFSGYLYSYYFYILKKLVDALLIDQSGRKTFPLIDNEDVDPDSETQPGFVAPPVPGVEELICVEEIDEYWVEGSTATGVFAKLTIQDRQLLKWRYSDVIIDANGNIRPVKSSDIAMRITEHGNTSRERIAKVKTKLRELLAQELNEPQNT